MLGDPAVLSAGTVNADFLLRVDAPLERGASLIASCLLRTSGGRAANVAVMARRLLAPARVFGCVGDDQLGEQALAGPRAAGVDLAGLRRVSGQTGLATILVDEGATKTMVLAAGVNDAFSDADGHRLAVEVRASGDRAVLVADTELRPAALRPAFEAANERGRRTVLDPTRPDRVTDELLALSDHLVPNADEAARLTGIAISSPDDARRAARRLRERGARSVHVRLPAGGCVSLWPEGEALVRPPKVHVVDSTGAGDAFAGALAASILARRPPVEAVRRAVAAATCAVSRLGAQESYPDGEVLDAMAARVRVTVR